MLGALIKQLREAKGLSQRRLAQQAGISHGTIGGWERGAYWPRLPELEALLNALDATNAQRKQALALIEAPRAVLHARAQSEQARADFVAVAGPAPLAGDLLRAMRLRRGLTLTEVAQALDVRASTVSRWERSEMWPESEHLHALCFLLQAEAEEAIALLSGPFRAPALAEEPASLEEWSGRIAHIYRGPEALRDLGFLALESRLWHLSAQQPSALHLLAQTYAYRARALMERNRFAEVDTYVERSLNLGQMGYGREEEWSWAVLASASVAYHRGRSPDPRRAARMLGEWDDYIHHPLQRTWVRSERAIYLAEAGSHEAAVTLSEETIALSTDQCESIDTRFRWRDHARILALSGHYGEALRVLNTTLPLIHVDAEALARHQLLEVRCLLGVGKVSEAQSRFHEAQQTLAAHNLEFLRPQVEALARRL